MKERKKKEIFKLIAYVVVVVSSLNAFCSNIFPKNHKLEFQIIPKTCTSLFNFFTFFYELKNFRNFHLRS